VVELLDFRKADIDLLTSLVATPGQQLGQAMQRLGAEDHIDIRCALDDGRAFLAGHAAAHAN
jgi:hypothetical protein